ncbi:MAG: hypothetical protein DRH56_02235 [Deltaproteobacteria bacterium]|nr:MAG: hypothetical protein DRH56_02235 [Deltaproteobacteria bacterium]
MDPDRLKEMSVGFVRGSGAPIPSRPSLVMIHGAGGCGRLWQGQVRLMEDSVNAVALDLPGHGGTAGKVPQTLEGYALWLSDVLAAAFPDPVFLMGHSMGGGIVLETALADPRRVRGLILAGTGPVLSVSPAFFEGFNTRFEETVDRLVGYGYGPGADSEMIREGARLMKSAGRETVIADFRACDRFDRRKDLDRLRLPCLIVCGEKDRLTPPALSRSLHEAIRGSRLALLPGVGHFAMIEAPRAFSRRVREFILSVSSPSGSSV